MPNEIGRLVTENGKIPVEDRKLLLNLKVLYIEDEEFTRNELSMYLKRRVGQLFTAKNGLEGLESFEINKPDLVLTDLKMPEMSGLEFIEAIRAKKSNCPVIVISALSDAETIIKTVDLGIIKYVIKPLDTTVLIENMETLAGEILKKNQGATILENKIVINKEEKLEAEKKIKGCFANFLKIHTGKGPKDVHVFIKANLVEVEAHEVLTLFELSLLQSAKNYGMVDFNRKVFYEENKIYIEEKIAEVLGTRIEIKEIRNSSKENIDWLALEIC